MEDDFIHETVLRSLIESSTVNSFIASSILNTEYSNLFISRIKKKLLTNWKYWNSTLTFPNVMRSMNETIINWFSIHKTQDDDNRKCFQAVFSFHRKVITKKLRGSAILPMDFYLSQFSTLYGIAKHSLETPFVQCRRIYLVL